MNGLPFAQRGAPVLPASMAEALALVRRGELQRASSLLMKGLHGGAERAEPASGPHTAAARFSRSDIEDVDDIRATSTAQVWPRAPAHTQGRARFSSVAFRHGGADHPFHLYVPASAAPPAGRAVILMLHGCTQDAQDFAQGTRMNAQAERTGALVLYPTQQRAANHNGCWNWFRPEDQRAGAGEPALLLAMLGHVMATEAVDPRRAYVAGLSAGGAMAAVLAREYPEVFAAVGVHSGLAARI